jgi:hypothetical protein
MSALFGADGIGNRVVDALCCRFRVVPVGAAPHPHVHCHGHSRVKEPRPWNRFLSGAIELIISALHGIHRLCRQEVQNTESSSQTQACIISSLHAGGTATACMGRQVGRPCKLKAYCILYQLHKTRQCNVPCAQKCRVCWVQRDMLICWPQPSGSTRRWFDALGGYGRIATGSHVLLVMSTALEIQDFLGQL